MREISEKQSAALKGVTARALKLAGGAGVVQHSTRIREATLSKCASNSDEHRETFVGIDVAVEIDLLAQSPVIAAAMAEMQGFRLVACDETGHSHAARPLTIHDALVIANEAADVVKAITEALADDGKIDAAEDKVITREIDELVRVLKKTLRNVSSRQTPNALRVVGEGA